MKDKCEGKDRGFAKTLQPPATRREDAPATRCAM